MNSPHESEQAPTSRRAIRRRLLGALHLGPRLPPWRAPLLQLVAMLLDQVERDAAKTTQKTHSEATPRRVLRARVLRRLDPDVQRREYRSSLARLVELLLDQVDAETFGRTFKAIELPASGGEA